MKLGLGEPAAAPPTGTARQVRTLCTYCGVGDPLLVRLEGGVVKADGPLGCCVKGAGFLAGNQPGDGRPRIEAPQIKRFGRWRPVSWQEAYRHVARRLLAIRRRHGRQSIAYYGVGQMTCEAMWLAKKLFQGYLGTNNVGSNAELCLAASAGGHELVFGNEGSFSCYADYLDAEVLVLYGSNQQINHPTIFERYFLPNERAVKVVIDPRITETVKAVLAQDPERNLHLRIRSGGDCLLNLALAHRLFERGWTDDDYLQRHVDPGTLSTFRETVLRGEYAPAAVARRIAVSEEAAPELERQIERLARLWATRKVVTTSSVGINQTSGSEGVALILDLHLLTANLGAPGRGHVRLAGQSNASAELAMGFNCKLLPFRLSVERRADRVRMAHLWDIHPWSLHPVRGVNVTDYPRADHLRFFLIQGTDFARNFPDLERWHAKLRRSFVVVCDPFEASDVRRFADVLLPGRTHAEIDGSFLNGERNFQALRQVRTPEVDAKSDVTLLVELAQAIAGELVALDQQVTDVNEIYLENRRRSLWSMLLPWDRRRRYPTGAPELAEIERLVRKGNLDLDPRPIRRNFAYPAGAEAQVDAAAVWAEVQRSSRGMYNEFSDGAGEPIGWERMAAEGGLRWGGDRRYLREETGEPDDPGAIFARRFRDRRERARLVLPREELLHPVPTGGDRFNLITGRGTIGERSEKYGVRVFNSGIKAGGDAPDEHPIFLHPDDARRLGVAPGDQVEVESERGRLQRSAAIADEVPPGHLFLSFYPDASGRTPNHITPSEHYCPHVFQPRIKILPVTLRRVSGNGA